MGCGEDEIPELAGVVVPRLKARPAVSYPLSPAGPALATGVLFPENNTWRRALGIERVESEEVLSSPQKPWFHWASLPLYQGPRRPGMALPAIPTRGQQLPKPLDKNPEPRGAAVLHVHLPGLGCQGGFNRY